MADYYKHADDTLQEAHFDAQHFLEDAESPDARKREGARQQVAFLLQSLERRHTILSLQADELRSSATCVDAMARSVGDYIKTVRRYAEEG